MSRRYKLTLLSAGLIIAVVLIDQIIKMAVKTHMYLGEDIELTGWFHIKFIENNGMAFGMELGGKYLLTSFRILMVPVLIWYIRKLILERGHKALIICLSLILAGNIGNVIDCLFYGLIFNNPAAPAVAQFVAPGDGYTSLMLGRVVDMFYFPLFEWNMPDWGWLNKLPFIPDADEHCVFFSAIFNFADASISCSVMYLLIFFKKIFKK